MSRRSQTAAPRPDMVKAVAEMLLNLEQISPDPSIVGRCPELPGIVLDKVLATCLDRDGPEYAKVNRDYEALRVEYFKALVAHPVGRALALLAVGPDGVAMMELGRPPAFVREVFHSPGTPIRGRRDSYNCHHIVPRSAPESNAVAVNHQRPAPKPPGADATNRESTPFLAQPFPSSPTHNAPASRSWMLSVHCFLSIRRSSRVPHGRRDQPERIGFPRITTSPEICPEQANSRSRKRQSVHHKSSVVPKEFHEITQMFGDLYKTQNRPRSRRKPATALQPRGERGTTGRRFFTSRRLY